MEEGRRKGRIITMAYLKRILYLTVAFGVVFCVYVTTTHLIEEIDEKDAAEVVRTEEKLYSEFKYIKDNTYLVTTKEKSPSSEARMQSVYFFIVIDPNESIYRLRVPEDLYYRTLSGEKLSVMEGTDKNYVLSADAESVYYKEKYLKVGVGWSELD